MDDLEAREFIDLNVTGAYVGEGTPAFTTIYRQFARPRGLFWCMSSCGRGVLYAGGVGAGGLVPCDEGLDPAGPVGGPVLLWSGVRRSSRLAWWA